MQRQQQHARDQHQATRHAHRGPAKGESSQTEGNEVTQQPQPTVSLSELKYITLQIF